MPNQQEHLITFRKHLESFYRSLQLAPPYHSIEKALSVFFVEFRTKSAEEQAQMHSNHPLLLELYLKAFRESGLNKKHRGIIMGLVNKTSPATLPKEHQYLLNEFIR